MMHLTTIIVSVNYEDYLQLVLPRVVPASDELLVITASNDEATMRLCQAMGVRFLCTNVFWHGKAKFNKGAAINVGLGFLQATTEWLLLLDADIILPAGAGNYLRSLPLDPTTIYGARRRLCPNLKLWNQYVRTGNRDLIKVERNAGRYQIGNKTLRCDAPATQGYFQLWNQRATPRRCQELPTAAGYDHRLAKQWPPGKRQYIPGDFEVIHLGPNKCNWKGRVTGRWHGALPLS